MSNQDRTTIQVEKDTLERLKDLKPFPSVSYDDLLNDMADEYNPKD